MSFLPHSQAEERPQLYALQPLFRDVQLACVFSDDKIFVDCMPRRPLHEIAEAYRRHGPSPLDRPRLKAFVEEHFLVPPEKDAETLAAPCCDNVRDYVLALWSTLRRGPDQAETSSTLLPLPGPYVVPGGRFREIYYWDSYFTMRGLCVCGERALSISMLHNFTDLLGRYGHIPNGNRSYYLSRSQPPLYAMMVELIAREGGPGVLARHRKALETEHAFWMDQTAPTHHLVRLPGRERLNRYWDQLEEPRPEALRIDLLLAERAEQPAPALFRNIRSACESGWDFSSRWFADGYHREQVRTTELVPVDLNCFLWQLETTLSRASEEAGDAAAATFWTAEAAARGRAIVRYCWSEESEFFCDYDLASGRTTEALTLAGATPLVFGLASPRQAAAVAERLRNAFLKRGGLATSLRRTGEQWDAPNGWAPLQWFAVKGLERYGYSELAREIAVRWSRMTEEVFRRTGRLWEKYDVEEPEKPSDGGEYASQHGFGWTNAVLLEFLKDYPDR